MMHIARSEAEIPQNTKQIRVFDAEDAASIMNHHQYSEGWYYHRDFLNRFLFVPRDEYERKQAANT